MVSKVKVCVNEVIIIWIVCVLVNEMKAVSVTEASRLLGISRNLAYEAIHRGEIPSVKIGGRILVPTEALNKMLSPSPGKE